MCRPSGAGAPVRPSRLEAAVVHRLPSSAERRSHARTRPSFWPSWSTRVAVFSLMVAHFGNSVLTGVAGLSLCPCRLKRISSELLREPHSGGHSDATRVDDLCSWHARASGHGPERGHTGVAARWSAGTRCRPPIRPLEPRRVVPARPARRRLPHGAVHRRPPGGGQRAG